MSTKGIIKKFLIKEAAGISFEVREWAKVIEKYVKDYVDAERAKMPKTTPISTTSQKYPPQYPSQYVPKENGETPLEDEEEIYEPGTEFTHFENEQGEVYEEANVYADELYINSDILSDFPKIKSAISGKLLTVKLDGEGKFFVDTEGSSFPEEYREAIEEMIEDHMVMGEAFYTNDYEFVFATSYDNEDYGRHFSYMTEASYDDYYKNYYQQPKIEKIEIDGNDFPEAFKNFNVDKWIITPSNRIEYDHWKSGYNEAGQYVVYLNMPLSSVGGSALVHEIKHAYDDWNRMKKGKPPIRAGWEIKNIYTPDFEKLVLGGSFKLSPMLHPIIRYYYLGSKLEAPAYLENEYDNSYLSGSYRDTAKKLMNFKASNFLDKKGNPAKGLQESWDLLIKEYDIPLFRKFKSVVDFLNYTEKYFNKRGRDIIKRIDKMRYVHNRPAPVYTPPKVYTQPKTTQATPVTNNPTTFTPSGLPGRRPNLNQAEIDRLDKQIDRLEDELDVLYDSGFQKNKIDIEELDIIIRGLLQKRNRLEREGRQEEDLPF